MAQTTFYSLNYIHWPPVHIRAFYNPDSLYWREQAETAVAEFDRKAPEFLNKADWELFNQLYLNHYGESVTWKQAFDCYKAALDALQPGMTVEAIAYAAGVLPEGVENPETI